MSFARDSAPERLRNARQLNIAIMMILGAGLSARAGKNSNIFFNILKFLAGSFLGWALGKSPEFFSQLRSKDLSTHDAIRSMCALSSYLLAAFSLANPNNQQRFSLNISNVRTLKITNTADLGMFLTVFSLIGPEVLDTVATLVARNKWTSGFAKYLAAGYTPPSGSTMLSTKTIKEFTPSLRR